MKEYLKYIPWVIIVLLVLGVAYYQYRAASNARALLKIKNEELMKANLDLGRANTKIADQKKTHSAAMHEINKKWKDEIKKREALITMYADLKGKYEAEKKKVKTLTKIVYRDRTTEKVVDLPKGKIFIRDENGKYREITSMTWEYKDFRITIEGDAIQQTLSYKLHQKFRGQFVETKLPTGARNHYFNLYEIDDKGKDVGKLKLDKFDVLRAEELPGRMMWWNPKLDLMIGAGANQRLSFSWTADIGVSLSAYGKTPNDLTWRFFRISTGMTGNGYSLAFSPAQFNLARYLPLVSNLWLVPYGGYDFGIMGAHFGMGVGVVF